MNWRGETLMEVFFKQQSFDAEIKKQTHYLKSVFSKE